MMRRACLSTSGPFSRPLFAALGSALLTSSRRSRHVDLSPSLWVRLVACRSMLGFRTARPLASHLSRTRISFISTRTMSLYDLSVRPPAPLRPALPFDGAHAAPTSIQVEQPAKSIPLADFKSKPVLFVNVASACGLTPQYKGAAR